MKRLHDLERKAEIGIHMGTGIGRLRDFDGRRKNIGFNASGGSNAFNMGEWEGIPA